ncbi:hypothetical protein JM84_1781 [Dokdonia sp. Hel_I_63]|uniref:NAD(P)H-dependent oxidoreductase n=1 Tax=unclassified Dokdonia TaxID=2615033 RepID=UPI00020A754F|nr:MULTISPECIES: NAD(P)H-dependent oxidoreductase [unclassified Dokdonia]AEE20886.1 nitroreductase [Dokdonia sp. 4H-3-7-5]TVZ22867.1 hypothetical protein JM84_1781 [Dokdonia sp. Hel_I_63]
MPQVIEALKWRYATKKFDNTRMLPDSKIEIIKNAFNLTATSFGLQPVRLVVVSNKEKQEALVPLSMNQRQVADASHVLIFCIEKQVDEHYVESYFDNVKEIRNTPEEIIKPFKNYLLDHFKKATNAENDLWASKQAYLAMGNLLTVCAIEEVDACPMEGFTPEGYDKFLGLTEIGLQSVLVLPIGYRAEDDMFSTMKKVRKSLDNAVLDL